MRFVVNSPLDGVESKVSKDSIPSRSSKKSVSETSVCDDMGGVVADAMAKELLLDSALDEKVSTALPNRNFTQKAARREDGATVVRRSD